MQSEQLVKPKEEEEQLAKDRRLAEEKAVAEKAEAKQVGKSSDRTNSQHLHSFPEVSKLPYLPGD